jgi:hypothetical protein
MFAVRVAAIPSPSSHRAREGTGIRCGAAYSTTIELAQTRPSIVVGSSRAVIPVSPCAPDDRVGVPVADIGCDARNGEHGHGGGHADDAVDTPRQGRGRVIVALGQSSALNPPRTASASSSCPSAVRIELRSDQA